jgi:uncharacterized YccA/Bax inhibitor family protein
MALFQSGNPTLSEKIFDKSRYAEGQMQGVMTVRGTINKFGFLMLMVIAGAAYTWHLYSTTIFGLEGSQGNSVLTLMYVGMFGGFGTALVVIFKPKWAPYLAPVYGLLEGFFLGAISAMLNQQFSKNYPGLVTQAVGLTFAVAIAMFLLYNFRIIKPTEKFKSVIISATFGIFIFYVIDVILFYGFHIDIPITSWNNSSLIGIGFSIFVVVLAALNLILDFDMIERGSDMGAPKYMEWYGAFGLLVTIVWLYIEILKLLSRFARRN